MSNSEFWNKVFSVSNSGKYRIIHILGMRIKFRSQYLQLREKLNSQATQLDSMSRQIKEMRAALKEMRSTILAAHDRLHERYPSDNRCKPRL